MIATVVRPSVAVTRLNPIGLVAPNAPLLDPAYVRPMPSTNPMAGPRISFFACLSVVMSGANFWSSPNQWSAYASGLASEAATPATMSSASPSPWKTRAALRPSEESTFHQSEN